MKKLGKVSLYVIGFILTVTAGVVFSGSFEDLISRTYILPNILNSTTTNLPSVGIPGRMAYDTTKTSITVDNGSAWMPLQSQGAAILRNQTTKPTVSTCGSASVATGSSDNVGSVNAGTGGVCTITFTTPFVNAPFCVAIDVSRATGIFLPTVAATGITASGLGASDVWAYNCTGWF